MQPAPLRPDDDDQTPLTSSSDGDAAKRRERRERVQAELDRVRREASLVKLQAKASRLEVVLQRIDAGEAVDEGELHELGIVANESPQIDPSTHDCPTVAGFDSWDAVRAARTLAIDGDESSGDHQTFTRTDAGHASVAAPAMRRYLPGKSPDIVRQEDAPEASASDLDATDATTEVFDAPDPEWLTETPSSPKIDPASVSVLESSDEDPPKRKTRSAAFLASTAVHLGVVLFLAMISLTTTLPKDQVALSASVGESEEVGMETFAIETNEPVTEPSESAPSETAYDLSPVGEMMAVEMPSDMMGQATAMAELSALSSSAKSTLKSLKSGGKSKSKMEFCGVEGGGNHFVYLVDSSGSMGDAFNSARQALLQSIEMLSEKQRFYVVFFDAESDYMQLTQPGVNDSRSVYATAENKQRLRNWAMRISMDRGRAPYDALRFALGLKPDVIFLLSDGEFPQGIEDLLAEDNKVTNLFGESNPISIVHTISYHSQEGESRMRRIAQKNMGQYRYIPKP